MTLIVYQCDTCKRTIQKPQNKYGLEVIGRCVITLGCRGKLTQVDVLQDYTRPAVLDNVPGLTNWQPRNVLFNYTQSVPSSTWDIVHDLNTFPVVDVIVNAPTLTDASATKQVNPKITIVSANEIILTFDTTYTGVAQLIARSTDPTLLQQGNVSPQQTSAPSVQLSNNGYLTIATRLSKFGNNQGMNIELQFTSNNVATSYTFASTTNTDDNSAWINDNQVVVNGHVYVIRQFSALTTSLTTGTSSTGTTFRFQGFDTTLSGVINYIVDPVDQVSSSPYLPIISSNDIMVLLANSPFTAIDKNTTQYIDVASVTTEQNIGALYYAAGEFFAKPSILEDTYPPITTIG